MLALSLTAGQIFRITSERGRTTTRTTCLRLLSGLLSGPSVGKTSMPAEFQTPWPLDVRFAWRLGIFSRVSYLYVDMHVSWTWNTSYLRAPCLIVCRGTPKANAVDESAVILAMPVVAKWQSHVDGREATSTLCHVFGFVFWEATGYGFCFTERFVFGNWCRRGLVRLAC